MSRDSSGTYSLPAGNPVVSGTTVSTSWANNTLSDIADELTNSLDKGGRTTPTANLPMGGFKFTGLAAGSAAGQSVRYEQTLLHGYTTVTGHATTADVFAAGTFGVLFTGASLTVTAFPTGTSGDWKLVTFDGVNTLTHNATSFDLPGSADITTASGDSMLVRSKGATGAKVHAYFRASGSPIAVGGGIPNGSAASPALYLTNSPTTGLYRVGADQLGTSIAGTLRWTLTASAATSTVPVLLPQGSSASPALAYSGGGGSNDQGIYFGTNSMTLQSNGVDAAYTLLPSTTIAHKMSSSLVGGTALNVYQAASSAIDETVLIQFNATAGTTFNAIRIEADASGTPNNIWRVRGDGATFADGAYSGSGADYAEAFLYTGERPVPGDTVALDGDRVRIAVEGDDIIGVVSEKACAVGDALLLEEGGVAVGLVGKLRVNPGRPVRPEWRRLGPDRYLVT